MMIVEVKNVINHKILTAILIPILLIPLAGCTYAHLTYTVIKRYKLHVRCGEINLETYKVYSPWNETMSDDLIDDTLFISATVSPPWHVWVGFMIKNNGIYAMNITEPIYQVIGDNVTWNSNEFYYGPYTEAEFNSNPDVWKSITGANYTEKLDPVAGVIGVSSTTPPITLEPEGHNKNKLIVWIYLEIVDALDDFYMELSIIIPATMVDPLVEGP